MDNNLTNIDDLFKQRLGNAEETGRPGSWLKMKDLLDEQMPVGTVPAAATGNKRKIGFAALLLLLSAITIGGGYEMYSSFKGNSVSDETMALYTSQSTTNGVISGLDNYAEEQIAQPFNEFNTTNNSNNSNTSNTAIGGAMSSTTDKKSSKSVIVDTRPSAQSNGVPSSKTVTNRNNSSISATSSEDSKALNNKELLASNVSETGNSQNVTSDKTNPKQISSQQPLQPKAVAGTTKPNKANINTSTPNNSDIKKSSTPQKVEQMALGAAPERMNNTGNKKLPSGIEKDINPVAKGAKPSGNKNNINETYSVDTIDKIEKRESIAKDGRLLVDTVSIDRVAIKSKKNSKEEPLDNTAMALNKDKDALPEEVLLQAQKAELQTEDGQGVYTELSNKKVASHKMKNYNEHRFEEMVRNAKFKMKSVKFYPGLVAGVNSSIGAQNVSGFQLGLVGDVTLSDKWSVLTELRYVQRFNNKIDFKEHYFSNLDSSYNSVGGKVYTFDSVENSYNFSTLSSFEMPIALRYSIKRFNVFGGANLAYNLKLKVAQVDLPNQITKESGSGFTPDYSNLAGAPSVKVSDFTNRFTVGYLLGVSYNWSPSMRVDMRLTQSIWDNAKTNGQKTISKELYNMPNVQLNISYRFKQKAYKKFR